MLGGKGAAAPPALAKDFYFSAKVFIISPQ